MLEALTFGLQFAGVVMAVLLFAVAVVLLLLWWTEYKDK